MLIYLKMVFSCILKHFSLVTPSLFIKIDHRIPISTIFTFKHIVFSLIHTHLTLKTAYLPILCVYFRIGASNIGIECNRVQ